MIYCIKRDFEIQLQHHDHDSSLQFPISSFMNNLTKYEKEESIWNHAQRDYLIRVQMSIILIQLNMKIDYEKQFATDLLLVLLKGQCAGEERKVWKENTPQHREQVKKKLTLLFILFLWIPFFFSIFHFTIV